MFVGILKTDGGPHSPEKWAYVSAAHMLDIFRVEANSPREVELEMAKDEMRAKITRIMIAHHTNAQTGELDQLAEHGSARLAHDLDHAHHVDSDEVTAEILAAFNGSPLQAFLGAHQVAAFKERIETDVRSIMDIERSWHADNAPADPRAQAYKAARTGAAS